MEVHKSDIEREARASIGRIAGVAIIMVSGLTAATLERDQESANFARSFAANCEQAPDSMTPTADSSWDADVAAVRDTSFFASEKQYDTINAGVIKKYNRLVDKIRGTSKPGTPKNPVDSKMFAEFNRADQQEQQSFEAVAQSFLGARGVSVDVSPMPKEKHTAANSAFIETGGPNIATLQSLAFLPKAIVTASGLSKVVYTESRGSNLSYVLPENQGGTLTAGYPIELIDGIAYMLLNSCPDRQAILDQLAALNGGSPYNYNVKYAHYLKGTKDFNDWTRKYGDVFYSPESMYSPEVEFVQIFTDAMRGWNEYTKSDLNTVLGQKKEFVQRIFDHFVPYGIYYEQFYNVAGYYGTHDLHPDDLATELLTLFKRMNSTSSAQTRNELLNVWDGEDSANQLPTQIMPRIPSYSEFSVSNAPYPYEPPSALQPASD